MLEIKDLYVSYGMMEVLHGVSVNVEDKELVSIIGPNGAGKTTLIKTVMGLVKPTSGQILYNGEDITHVPAHKRASMGIGYVPEGRRVFGKLTVDENLRMGAYELKDKTQIAKNIEMVYGIFPRLGPHQGDQVQARHRQRRSGDQTQTHIGIFGGRLPRESGLFPQGPRGGSPGDGPGTAGTSDR